MLDKENLGLHALKINKKKKKKKSMNLALYKLLGHAKTKSCAGAKSPRSANHHID